jgi:hypothetical protein
MSALEPLEVDLIRDVGNVGLTKPLAIARWDAGLEQGFIVIGRLLGHELLGRGRCGRSVVIFSRARPLEASVVVHAGSPDAMTVNGANGAGGQWERCADAAAGTSEVVSAWGGRWGLLADKIAGQLKLDANESV